jgi:phosphate transport system protein
LDQQLEKLNKAFKKMGRGVQAAISDATKALLEQDKELAEIVISSDDEIDKMEKKIERICLKMIMRELPVAGDLRQISAILKMTADLERIADHASDISKIVLTFTDEPYIKKLDHIPQMAEITMQMVKDSINAFVEKDEDLARTVMSNDSEVNRLFSIIKNELVELIDAGTSQGGQIVNLLMIAKYFERIGDHATNISEWMIFTLTGVHKDRRIM